MADEDTIAGLLQALEHVSDQVALLSEALDGFISAQERGEAMPEAVVADYREMLGRVREQLATFRQRIAHWWVLVGHEKAQ
jgi:hypothetical protein